MKLKKQWNNKTMKQLSSGFTILELLVVISIMVIIGSLISGILFSTLRGTNKTKITNAVSQNGNYAMSVMTDIIRSSTNVVSGGATCASASPTPAQTIALSRLDGGITTLSCTGNTVASVSASTVN